MDINKLDVLVENEEFDGVLVRSDISHWIPIITRCPLSWKPDFIKITVHCEGFMELYAVRKQLYKFFWKKMFMEDIAKEVLQSLPGAEAVTVKLWMGPHTTTAYKE